MSERTKIPKGGERHVIIQEKTRDEFCKKIDEAVEQGAKFLPETFQHVVLPGRANNYVGMIVTPAEVR
ncbi:MAG: hypothetical protein OXO50_05810 [Caldilineaceae bacterium]|nr:hypothetical protein [Caldilineaceae bacterium]